MVRLRVPVAAWLVPLFGDRAVVVSQRDGQDGRAVTGFGSNGRPLVDLSSLWQATGGDDGPPPAEPSMARPGLPAWFQPTQALYPHWYAGGRRAGPCGAGDGGCL